MTTVSKFMSLWKSSSQATRAIHLPVRSEQEQRRGRGAGPASGPSRRGLCLPPFSLCCTHTSRCPEPIQVAGRGTQDWRSRWPCRGPRGRRHAGGDHYCGSALPDGHTGPCCGGGASLTVPLSPGAFLCTWLPPGGARIRDMKMGLGSGVFGFDHRVHCHGAACCLPENIA